MIGIISGSTFPGLIPLKSAPHISLPTLHHMLFMFTILMAETRPLQDPSKGSIFVIFDIFFPGTNGDQLGPQVFPCHTFSRRRPAPGLKLLNGGQHQGREVIAMATPCVDSTCKAAFLQDHKTFRQYFFSPSRPIACATLLVRFESCVCSHFHLHRAFLSWEWRISGKWTTQEI